MSRRTHRRRSLRPVPGALPELKPVEPLNNPCKATVLGYGPGGYKEIACDTPAQIAAFAKEWPVVWVDVDGLGNTALILALAETFGISRLALEDVFDVTHLPKIEIYDNAILMILKNGVAGECFETEHIGMVVMEHMVITFQERPGDSFLEVRKRIEGGLGKIRQFGPDFLAYALIDGVVEGYYPILNAMQARLDAIEDTFIDDNGGGRNVIRRIHDIKRDLLYLHSAIWPIHDITLALSHDDVPFVTQGAKHYLRDCQDQAKQVKDLSEFYRLIASDLMNTYLAFNDNKANQIMKLLTMVATIFIPLSFISSLYGMNFDPAASPYNMPELKMRYGYPVVLAVMLSIVVGLLLMFWRRGWFGRKGNELAK